MRRVLLAVLLAFGCSHGAKVPSGKTAYPFGTYHHRVQVQASGADFELQGVVRTAPGEWSLSALSAAGTTLFRLTEQGGSSRVENFQNAIAEDRIRHLGRWLRKFMTADVGQREFEYDGAEFVLDAPDERDIPRRVRIEHRRVRIKVEVLDYRLL